MSKFVNANLWFNRRINRRIADDPACADMKKEASSSQSNAAGRVPMLLKL
jgi:hypothetical protein